MVDSKTKERFPINNLIREFRTGSQEAFVEVVARFGPRIAEFLRLHQKKSVRDKISEEDLLQEFWRTLLRCRYTIPKVDSDDEFERLLNCIAKRQIRKQTRKYAGTQARDTSREEETDAPIVDRKKSTPSSDLIAKELLDTIAGTATAHESMIVELKIDGFSNTEIAKRTGTTEVHIRRVLSRLRQTVSEG